MELDNIEKLLEKYFDATSTVADEKRLKAYFSQDNIAEHLQQYTPIFQALKEARAEGLTKELLLESHTTAPVKRKHKYKWFSVAAVMLLMLGVYVGNQYKKQKETEYAYKETKKALDLLAANFNKGAQKVVYLNKFEEVKQKIYNKN